MRVAVVGAGPAGLYTAQSLVDAGALVDVIDRLAAPYGLVRYGVAPDHMRMKSVVKVLRKPFTASDAGFIGNVTVGQDLSLADLREHYHAVVYATGCPLDRSLGIPGEDLTGSIGSGRFVGWYCGHPDVAGFTPPLEDPGAVVIGAGNVALDVTRVLAVSPDRLRATDVPDPVLAALAASRVRDIHVVIRRGPWHARFTPAELRGLGELDNTRVLVHDDGTLTRADPAGLDLRQRQNLQILREWSAREHGSGDRRIHLWFLRTPVALRGDDRVHRVVVERTRVEHDRVVATGEQDTLAAGLVVRAIGYRSGPVDGLPFDTVTGTVPNERGRVAPGLYVAGWLKRGPSGVIGTNKADGAETAAAVLEDLPHLSDPAHSATEHLRRVLDQRGVRHTDWPGWLRIDAEERHLGSSRGAERIKVCRRGAMVRLARAAHFAST
ncbi:FAD-dependent oxidoreductase [Amycolatopsis alkalitolerans]|uniref:ferredoxin--NADP(+) reductase n=1 Tax=Amycolatopsis alkalitolerans TaxID=2547244 RepID=A0A5C4LZ89_9PSEU|nr:FAD-dependent oxidoreductase [Amycolatopsis alkalitolerans]TNC25167.1 pyridine nucleotide-disulfide oxidoreductase [Amycolatopsis alkalitolerans]